MNAYSTLPLQVFLSDASFKELLHMQISQRMIMFDGADVLTPLTDLLGSCVYVGLAGTVPLSPVHCRLVHCVVKKGAFVQCVITSHKTEYTIIYSTRLAMLCKHNMVVPCYYLKYLNIILHEYDNQ